MLSILLSPLSVRNRSKMETMQVAASRADLFARSQTMARSSSGFLPASAARIDATLRRTEVQGCKKGWKRRVLDHRYCNLTIATSGERAAEYIPCGIRTEVDKLTY